MKTKIKILFLVVFLSVNSSIHAQDFECFVIEVPEKPLLNVKKIAVLKFSNFDNNPYYDSYGGNAFINYLTSSLLQENRGIYNLSQGLFGMKEGKTYIKSSAINILDIVEREQINNVLSEKNLNTEINLDDNQAAEVGKVLGIDALVMGTVKHIYNSNRSLVKLTDGSTTNSTENKCNTEISLKVVSVLNGQIMATKTFKRESSDKKWGRDESTVLGFESLAERNLKGLAFDAANYITPYYTYYKANFKKLKTKEYKDKANDIKKYIENADFASLYSIYKTVYDADNYYADAAYNLALLYAVTGDYTETAKWDRIANEADPATYGKAKEWATEWEQMANTLANLGVVIDKVDFSSNLNADALSDKVKTKGSRSDRFETYEKADINSTIVTKIPGDSEFIIIEKTDKFTKIKLLGGKEGYISNENIKK